MTRQHPQTIAAARLLENLSPTVWAALEHLRDEMRATDGYGSGGTSDGGSRSTSTTSTTERAAMALDALGVGVDAGSRAAGRLLRAAGHKHNDRVIRAAQMTRKQRPLRSLKDSAAPSAAPPAAPDSDASAALRRTQTETAAEQGKDTAPRSAPHPAAPDAATDAAGASLIAPQQPDVENDEGLF